MRGLRAYLLTRIVVTLPMLFVLLSAIFVVLRVMPGDPAEAMLGGRHVPPEAVAALRSRLGLDRPLPVQFVSYLAGVLQGDLGLSARTGNEVIEDVLAKFPATMELAVFATAVAVPLGLLTGVLGATQADRPADHVCRLVNVASFATFIPWLGMMLQMLFSVWLGWFPVGGRLSVINLYTFQPVTGFYVLDALLTRRFDILVDALRHLALPSLTLGFVLSGLIGRISRANMLEALQSDYVRTARAKGLSEFRIVWGHALRNALIPTVTVVGLQFALLMAGAVLTETTFAWPGVGSYLLESIRARDFNAIQGSVVVIALFVTGVNLVVDALYAWLDPRVKY